MLERIVSYRVVCDTPDCHIRTAPLPDETQRHKQAVAHGWEFCEIPGACARIWRCPGCVASGRHPDGWGSD